MKIPALLAHLRTLALVAALTAAALAPGAASAEPAGPVVVELFTSQGCSSCPPADAYLGELARRADVVALSFHVDYWDYIGWPDPFASRETTDRQRDYGHALGQRFIYTPEMVVDGRVHSSSLAEIARHIKEAGNRPKLAIEFASNGGKHSVRIPAADYDGKATVWLVFYDASHETAVPRGENRGRTVRNYNVVRSIEPVGTWTGQAAEIPLNTSAARKAGRNGCAVIVQDGTNGPVLGAAKMAFEAGG